MYTDSAKKMASVANLALWVAGTSNQIAVANDGDGTITLSTPQDIHTGASPTFANVMLADGGALKVADGSPQIVLDNSNGYIEMTGGNVGIGTTTPSQFLELSDDINHSSFVGIKVTETELSGKIMVGVFKSPAGDWDLAGLWMNTDTPSASNFCFSVATTGNTYFNGLTGQRIFFQINNASKMTLDSIGRLGIGVTAPGTLLQLKGADAYLTLQNSTAENTDGGAETKIIFEDHANAALAQIQGSHDGVADDTKGDLILSTHTGAALTEALRLDSAQLATFAAKIAAGTFASPTDVTATRQYGTELHYSGNNYDVTGIRSRAQLITTDTTASAQGALLQASNTDGINAGVLNGALIEAIGKSDSTASTITMMRGCLINTEWNAKETITDLRTLHVRTHSRDAATEGYVSGTSYGIYIENEAVGGNGQAYDAGIYFKGTNLSGGNKAFTYGIDFSGGTYGSAEIKLSNGETISNLVDGDIAVSGNITLPDNGWIGNNTGSAWQFHSDVDFITTAARVGIGTLTPVSLLHLWKASTGYLKIEQAGAGNYFAGLNVKSNDANLWFFSCNAAYTNTPAYAGKGGLQVTSGNLFISASDANRDIEFYAGNRTTPKMFIEGSNGNVGINTTTPDAKLQVVGDCKFGDDNTNYTSFSATGVQTMTGSARVKKEEIIGAGIFHKSSSAPDDVYLSNGMHVLAFDKTTVQHGHYETIIPLEFAAGTEIDIELDWAFDTVEADHYMTWVVEYVLIADGEDPAKAITRTYQKSVISTGNNDKQLHMVFGTGITGAAADDTLLIKIYRDCTGTYDTDDLAQDAWLLAAHLHCTVDKLGEAL